MWEFGSEQFPHAMWVMDRDLPEDWALHTSQGMEDLNEDLVLVCPSLTQRIAKRGVRWQG